MQSLSLVRFERGGVLVVRFLHNPRVVQYAHERSVMCLCVFSDDVDCSALFKS